MKVLQLLFVSMLVLTVELNNGCANNSPSSSLNARGSSSVVVSTLAGSAGVTGSTNATGTAATFAWPFEVSINSSGNICVSDYLNDMARLVTPAGVVTTLASSVAPLNTNNLTLPLLEAFGIGADSSGNIYVADPNNNLIKVIDSSGNISTVAGGGTGTATNATGTNATFAEPAGIVIAASGNIYVADMYDNMIRKIGPGVVVSTLAGGGPLSIGSVNATGTAASFNYPVGVAVDSSENVYVADTSNNLIRKITTGGVVTTLAGSAGVTGATNGAGTAASFSTPKGIAVDRAGNVYVADSGNDLIRKITSSGIVSTVAGSAGVTGSTNGTENTALFNDPTGITIDSSGILYVADYGNDLIRKIQ